MDETSRRSGGPDERVLANRYVLRGLVGSGGMADVELADDTLLDRQVAVKILHGRYADDPSFLERFRREAQSAASLNHPNIVGVYDTGSSNGQSYIVMEYVAGRSLRDVLREEGVSPHRAAEMTADIAGALHYAHEQGLVHRDVKPGNILVSYDGRVKVADFGIARAVSAETVTQTAAVFGTAAYVSPEQAQGQRVDRRTDVYSLGCVLYEMLVGRQPFEGESAVTLAYKHVSEPPTPPSHLAANVSPQLEAVTLRALAKDPADRYQTAREFEADLRRVLAGASVTAPLGGGAAYATTRAVEAAPTTVQEPYWQPEPPPPEPDRTGRRGLGIFLAVLLLGVAGLAVLLLSDLLQPTPAAEVEVPDVRNLDVTEATNVLVNAGFETEAEEVPHNQVEEDMVIETQPPGGSTAEEGSTVLIRYSGGPELATVPDVSGLSEGDARQELTDAGFTIGTRQSEASDEVDRGDVIRSEPAGGTEAAVGTEVSLVVSEGPQLLTLPNVVGEELDDAFTNLNEFCGTPPCVIVRENSERVASDTYDEGQVVEQDPEGGSEVQRQSTVVLTISSGPAVEEEEEEENGQDGQGGLDGGVDGTNTTITPPPPTPPVGLEPEPARPGSEPARPTEEPTGPEAETVETRS